MNTSCTRVGLCLPIHILLPTRLRHAKIVAGIPLAIVFAIESGVCPVFCSSQFENFHNFVASPLLAKDQLDVSGYLSRNIFRPVSPTYRNIMLTTFLFAVSSVISPGSDFTLGFASSTVLVNSFIDMEYLAIIATANRSHHFSHSIDCDFEASCQNRGNPTN